MLVVLLVELVVNLMNKNEEKYGLNRQRIIKVLHKLKIDPLIKDNLGNRGALIRMLNVRSDKFLQSEFPRNMKVLYIGTDIKDFYVNQEKTINELSKSIEHFEIIKLQGDDSRLGHGVSEKDSKKLESNVLEFLTK
ncbi:MAG TPA: hypothetical protein PLS49_00950 [Candidatus Woesebacteria bacterium]|nr:hypothetical protein [Candidatus Woesebacteria bacterium]